MKIQKFKKGDNGGYHGTFEHEPDEDHEGWLKQYCEWTRQLHEGEISDEAFRKLVNPPDGLEVG